MSRSWLWLIGLLFVAGARSAAAEELNAQQLVSQLTGLSVEGLYYLTYQNGEVVGAPFNRFAITRGYTTLKRRLTEELDSRLTMDVTQDNTGDVKVRLKYAYALFKLPSWKAITNPQVEFGMVHTPWLEFEEYVNLYRMQGTMFMERAGLFNSGDFGFTAAALLGGEMDEAYQKTVSGKFPGRHGSVALGFYNGGGYHAVEYNQNKVFQGRLTIRPLPDEAPGAQLSYLGIFGKGNQPEDTDWQTNAAMLSYEHRLLTATAQLVTGRGRNKGDWSDEATYHGYSGFAEFKPGGGWRIIARGDLFDPDDEMDFDKESRIIGGFGYDFGRRNILLLDYDALNYQNSTDDSWSVNLTMQVIFRK